MKMAMRGILLAAAMLMSQHALSQRTIRPNLRLKQSAATEHIVDTIALQPGQIVGSGYEKTLKAGKETIFITNNTDTAFTGLAFSVEYFDIYGNQLHKRIVDDVSVSLDPGETRMVNFDTWDKQRVWYYRLSEPARTSSPASPYDVKVVFIEGYAPSRKEDQ